MQLVRRIKSKGGRGYGLFECNDCNKTFERRLDNKAKRCLKCSYKAMEVDNKRAKQKLYHVWLQMKTRCKNTKHKRFKDYGGRGIFVCKQWEDYLVFKNWAINSGYSSNLSIDRINNNGGYEPCNCRWATNKEQMNNTRVNKIKRN